MVSTIYNQFFRKKNGFGVIQELREFWKGGVGRQCISCGLYLRGAILCLHDLLSQSPKVCFPARSGPPFVIRAIPIQ